MFKFNELKQIHLEITNNCQARCPMCSRNHHGGLENPLIQLNSWTLDDFKTIINHEVLDQVESLFFCGNFGDPLLNNELVEMCRYVSNYSPDTYIRIHTNGSLRDTAWWEDLADALPDNHMVIFGIDGLEDTNHLYRIGTSFKKIIENASAFIKAGGNADWTYIIFKHNEHQVLEAEQLSKTLGFKVFTKKHSSRFLLDKTFDVLDKTGKISHRLEPSTENKMVFMSRDVIKNYKLVVEQSDIDCFVLKNKEVYIDAFGKLFPCCWVASTPYNYRDPNSEMMFVFQEMLSQYNDLIQEFGGIDNLDTRQHSVQSIIDSSVYQTIWNKYWSNPKLITCAKSCGTHNISKPRDQFIDRKS